MKNKALLFTFIFSCLSGMPLFAAGGDEPAGASAEEASPVASAEGAQVAPGMLKEFEEKIDAVYSAMLDQAIAEDAKAYEKTLSEWHDTVGTMLNSLFPPALSSKEKGALLQTIREATEKQFFRSKLQGVIAPSTSLPSLMQNLIKTYDPKKADVALLVRRFKKTLEDKNVLSESPRNAMELTLLRAAVDDFLKDTQFRKAAALLTKIFGDRASTVVEVLNKPPSRIGAPEEQKYSDEGRAKALATFEDYKKELKKKLQASPALQKQFGDAVFRKHLSSEALKAVTNQPHQIRTSIVIYQTLADLDLPTAPLSQARMKAVEEEINRVTKKTFTTAQELDKEELFVKIATKPHDYFPQLAAPPSSSPSGDGPPPGSPSSDGKDPQKSPLPLFLATAGFAMATGILVKENWDWIRYNVLQRDLPVATVRSAARYLFQLQHYNPELVEEEKERFRSMYREKDFKRIENAVRMFMRLEEEDTD